MSVKKNRLTLSQYQYDSSLTAESYMFFKQTLVNGCAEIQNIYYIKFASKKSTQQAVFLW